MKKYFPAQVFALCVSVLLVSFVIPVNSSSLPQLQQGVTLVADGVPLPPGPPPPPPPSGITNALLDGVPLPPGPPPPPPSGGIVGTDDQGMSRQS